MCLREIYLKIIKILSSKKYMEENLIMKNFLKQSTSIVLFGLFLLSSHFGLLSRHVMSAKPPILSEFELLEESEFRGDDGTIYILGKFINAGNECVVYECVRKGDGKVYAVKVRRTMLHGTLEEISSSSILEILRNSYKPRDELELSDFLRCESCETKVAPSAPRKSVPKPRNQSSQEKARFDFSDESFSDDEFASLLTGSKKRLNYDNDDDYVSFDITSLNIKVSDDDLPLSSEKNRKAGSSFSGFNARSKVGSGDDAVLGVESSIRVGDVSSDCLAVKSSKLSSPISLVLSSSSSLMNRRNVDTRGISERGMVCSLPVFTGGVERIECVVSRQTPCAVQQQKPKPLGVEFDSVIRSPFVVDVLSKGKHPNLPEILSFCPYVEERCVQSLENFVSFARPEEKQVIMVGLGTLDALLWLHSQGICHRDVKLANVFLTDDGVAKLLDFGAASLFKEATGKHRVGSVGYMSDEMWDKALPLEEKYMDKVDVFNWGIMMMEMLLPDFHAIVPADANGDEEANSAERNKHIFDDICADKYSLSLEWKEILLGCLNPNPSERLTAQEVKDLVIKFQQ